MNWREFWTFCAVVFAVAFLGAYLVFLSSKDPEPEPNRVSLKAGSELTVLSDDFACSWLEDGKLRCQMEDDQDTFFVFDLPPIESDSVRVGGGSIVVGSADVVSVSVCRPKNGPVVYYSDGTEVPKCDENGNPPEGS